MRDVLIVTGPMNSVQLGVPKDADYDVISVHPKGKDIGSTAMYQTMQAWLGGLSLRARAEKHAGGPVGKIGVAWFSAGHGSIKAILAGPTTPSDVTAWLCLDGLYGSNKWAIKVTEAAMANETSIIATASTSTPGQYDHSLDRWRTVVEANSIPSVLPSAASQWGLPAPNYAWGSGSCLIAGYEDLGHHKQVPAVRSGMIRWWNAARSQKEPEVKVKQDARISPAWLLAIVGAGGVAGWVFNRLVNPK